MKRKVKIWQESKNFKKAIVVRIYSSLAAASYLQLKELSFGGFSHNDYKISILGILTCSCTRWEAQTNFNQSFIQELHFSSFMCYGSSGHGQSWHSIISCPL